MKNERKHVVDNVENSTHINHQEKNVTNRPFSTKDFNVDEQTVATKTH